jgi:glycosyltransferase involved in cell wall biosynthesis
MSETVPRLELVVPLLNEAHVLEQSVSTIHAFLSDGFPYRWSILLADNGSTDGTNEVADRLAEKYEEVEALRLLERGRGRALRLAWRHSDADILAYTDVDISTELEALEKLCRAIVEEGYDVAIGSRLLPDSQVARGPLRETISRSYNLIVQTVLGIGFKDAQCGFKAISRKVADEIVPQVVDEAWFFDTELLVLAEKSGLSIREIPVRWTDDDDSRVKIFSTAWEDIKGVLRVRRLLWSRAWRDAHRRG